MPLEIVRRGLRGLGRAKAAVQRQKEGQRRRHHLLLDAKDSASARPSEGRGNSGGSLRLHRESAR